MVVVHLFNHPVPAALLLTLALLGLVLEVRSHGFGRAGWAGLLALTIFVASHLAEGTPLWTILPIAAGALVLWPAFEDATLRLQGAAGVFLIAAGAYLVMVGPGPARLDHAQAAAVLAAATFLMGLTAALLWNRLPAAARPGHRAGVFFLRPGAGLPAEEGPGTRSGARGTAVSPLRPGGWALIEGERLEVVSEGEWVDEGDEVEVVGEAEVHLRVRPFREGLDAPSPRRPDDPSASPDPT